MSVKPVSPESSNLSFYLDFLFSNQSGVVYCPSKLRSPEGDKWTQEFFHWPEQKLALISYIKKVSEEREVYVSPSLFSEENSQKSNLKGSQVVWVEMDGDLPESLDSVPEPNLKIRTSENGHEHWYWKLSDFITDHKITEQINRGLAYHLGADTSGWDANQVLRPPDTKNHKRQKPVQVFDVQKNRFLRRLELTEFDTVPQPPVAEKLYSEADLVDTDRLLTRYQWPDAAVDLFRNKNVEEGERSTKLMNLGYYVAEIGLTDRECFSVLYNADRWWGKFHDRDDRDQRLNDIIVRARLKYPTGGSDKQQAIFQFDFAHALHEEELELKWGIEGCLEEQGCMVISARPGVGKTRLSLQAAISLALGEPFLDYLIPEPQKVAFFSLEMHKVGIKKFMDTMGQDFTEEQWKLLGQNLAIESMRDSIDFFDIVTRDGIHQAVKEHGFHYLFFDSLGRTTRKSLNSDDDSKAIFERDSEIRQELGVTTWFVHHNRKSQTQNKNPKDQDDLFGSVYIAAGATDIYTLWKKPETTQLWLINNKHRYCEQEQPYVLETMGNLMFEQSDEPGVTDDDSSPEQTINGLDDRGPIGI